MHPNYAYNLSVVRVLTQTVKLAPAAHEPPYAKNERLTERVRPITYTSLTGNRGFLVITPFS